MSAFASNRIPSHSCVLQERPQSTQNDSPDHGEPDLASSPPKRSGEGLAGDSPIAEEDGPFPFTFGPTVDVKPKDFTYEARRHLSAEIRR